MRPLPSHTHRLPAGQVRRRATGRALIVEALAHRHNPRMKLFLPSARATNYLLIVGFCSLGYALYIRYLAIEQANVGLALSLIHISEPTRQAEISYAVF